jgi:hypothetical protein
MSYEVLAMMTLERLRQILDAYGASPERWPAAERDAALALLDSTPEARAARNVAARLDAALDLAPAADASDELTARVLAELPGAVADVAPSHAEHQRRAAHVRDHARRGPHHPRRRARTWRYAAVGLPLAAALLLFLRGSDPERSPTAQIAIADLGDYETPMDVLLTPPGFDVFSTMPAFGCTDDGLGCSDVVVPVNVESRVDQVRRIRA